MIIKNILFYFRKITRNFLQYYYYIKDFIFHNINDIITMIKCGNLLEIWSRIYTILFIIATTCLLFRSINFINSNNSWNLYTIYDRNGNIIATDSDEYYLQLTEPLTSIESSELSHSQKQELLEKEILCVTKPLKTPISGTKQFLGKYRFYNGGKYVTTLGISDHRKGIKKGLEIMASNGPIHTTIDLTTQLILAKILEDGLIEMKADGSFGIVLNFDGEIEALHSTQCPDPKDENKDFISPLNCLYEFGSTIKALTFFVGLFHEKFTLNDVFPIYQGVSVGGRPMKDVDHTPSVATALDVLKYSSNIGTVMIAKKIGPDLLFQTFKQMKMMDPVLSDFGETPRPKYPKNPQDCDKLTMSYGYSNNTNLLNVARAFLMLVNNGQFVTPHLLKKTSKKKYPSVFSMNKNIKRVCEQTLYAMKGPASRESTLLSFGCSSKTGTNNRVINGFYSENSVNTFIVCFLPDKTGEFKKLLIFGLLNPRSATLAGLTVRSLMVKMVSQLGSLIY